MHLPKCIILPDLITCFLIQNQTFLKGFDRICISSASMINRSDAVKRFGTPSASDLSIKCEASLEMLQCLLKIVLLIVAVSNLRDRIGKFCLVAYCFVKVQTFL